MNIKKFSSEIILAVILTANALYAFEITDNTRIVISQNAAETTLLAAREIADYTRKVSGIEPGFVQSPGGAVSQIIIGTLADIKNLPLSVKNKLEAAKSPDAFAIVCRGNKLIIAGKDRAGELYGTYAFLSEKMGILWFRAASANDAYEYVPSISRLQFADFEIFRDPVFRYRLLTHSGATGKIPVNGQTLAVRQGFQINPPWNYKRAFQEKFYQERCSMLSVDTGGHGAFSTPLPQSLYEKHPEYFAMQDGKRIKGGQICISNPEVQHLVQKYIEDIYKNIPVNRISWIFGMPDSTTGWCECTNCRQLDGSGIFDHINISSRFHKVVSGIMTEIYKKYPTAMLEVWAYHTYRTIPENVKYDPRTLIYYCTHGRCYGHKLSDLTCQRNVKHLQLIKAWRKISSRMKVYEYANCTPVFYGCMEKILTEDLRLYRKLGLEGWKEEMFFADAQFWPPVKKGEYDQRADRADSNWQWYCVAGKLLWNPELDPSVILDDVESKYYGKTYPAMKKYHNYRRQLWNNSAVCLGYPTGDQRRETLLSVPGAREKLLALLDEAEKLAGNDVILKGRLKDDRAWLQRYWIAPNEKFSKKQIKTGSVPLKIGNITIDGDPADAEWNRAWHTCDFKYIGGQKKGRIADKKDEMVLSILSDEKKFYFRVIVNAGKKKSGKNTDNIVLFLMPPADQTCYFAIVNSDGIVRSGNFPGNYKRINKSLSTAVKNIESGYVMEVEIPISGMGTAVQGDLWKLHVVRYNANGAYLSLDGIKPLDKDNYRGCVIGSAFLRNGTFEVLNKDGIPANWIMEKSEVIRHGAANSIKLSKGGYIYQLLAHGELGQRAEARKIRLNFRAAGQGVLRVYVMRYTDTPDGKAQHGYKRKFISTDEIYQANLAAVQKSYSCEYTIDPDEWIGLRFVQPGAQDGTAELKDVSVAKIPNNKF